MANVTLTVPNKNGSYDGDMVVKQYTSMTINSGDTLTVDQPCRGLMIFVQGDCTINGTIDMRNMVPYANPTTNGSSSSDTVPASGLQFPFLTSSGSDTLSASTSLLSGCGTTAKTVIGNFKSISSNGNILTLVRQGAAGGAGTTGSSARPGNAGSNGSTGQTGGGGSGGAYFNRATGAGSYGSCWGGGSGGGGSDDGGDGTDATAWAGPGGDGAGAGSLAAQGGAGHPGGASGSSSILPDTPDGYAGGGALILIVGGDLTIGATGQILCNSTILPEGSVAGHGGHAGGGNVIIAHRGTYTNNGTVTVTPPLPRGNGDTDAGGRGGVGSIQTLQIA